MKPSAISGKKVVKSGQKWSKSKEILPYYVHYGPLSSFNGASSSSSSTTLRSIPFAIVLRSYLWKIIDVRYNAADAEFKGPSGRSEIYV